MPNTTSGVGRFVTPTIIAVLRAIPDSDGTYRDVAQKAENHGANIKHATLARWLHMGWKDIAAGNATTAIARFTKRFEELVTEHCWAEILRTRDLDRAFEIMARTCGCGNDKMLMPEGTVTETCRDCKDLDNLGRSGRRKGRQRGEASPE